ncbi:MAG: periplasmic component of amino acid ABC-type transporter/signal transduction system [Candidatus Taylorbacteria bacterium]|nr:periplasmic component of amino acid ABC-type transporter/signal transduction system [Candidatus Taylorbacteria bacterium]
MMLHMNTKNKLLVVLICIGCILVIGVFRNHGTAVGDRASTSQSSILDRVLNNKAVRIGYAAYPPYVVKDLKTGALSGYYIDIANELADRMGVKIEWIETTWNTYISDLKTGKFDVLADPMYPSVPRLEQIDFSVSIGYFNGVAAVVKSGDRRFSKLEDLNKKGIIIAAPQSWTAEDYAKKYFPLATIKSYPGDSPALTLSTVLTDNADVALADGPSVQQYIEKNQDQAVKPLFLDNPTVLTGAGFGLPKGDYTWTNFINNSLDVMTTDSTLKNLAKKYHLYSYGVETKFVPQ